VPPDPLRVGYYVDIDLAAWGRKIAGDEFIRYVEAHRQPIDVVIGLAREYGMVLLNGSGFEGPAWSVRVSLANLETDDYATIGRNLAAVMRRAIARWEADEDARRGHARPGGQGGVGIHGAPPR
jgi:aspartate 4-decarboxylase